MSPRRALSSFAVLIVVSLHVPAAAAAAPVGDCQAGAGWPASLPATAADVVERVNAHRTGRGLAPLAVSPTLTAAAEWKARHMARYGYMQHDDPAVVASGSVRAGRTGPLALRMRARRRVRPGRAVLQLRAGGLAVRRPVRIH